MSRYSIYYTKADAKKAVDEVVALAGKLGMDIDLKKVKAMGGDAIATTIGILKKKVAEKGAL